MYTKINYLLQIVLLVSLYARSSVYLIADSRYGGRYGEKVDRIEHAY